VTTTTSILEEQTLGIAKVSNTLDELDQRMAGLEADLRACSGERRVFQLLDTILDSLDELHGAGAADLFWNQDQTRYTPDPQLELARQRLAAFHGKLAEIEMQREAVQRKIAAETGNLRRLNTELLDLEEEAEDRRSLLPVTREGAEMPYRPLVMPWSRNGEDDRRYRKVMLGSVALSLCVGALVLWMKPGHVARQEEFIPEHVAELVVKKKEEPKKPDAKKQDAHKPSEHVPTPKDTPQAARQAPSDKDAPNHAAGPLTDNPDGTPDAQQVAKASVQTKGVLAHQNEFAGLIDSSGPVKSGAEGVVSNTGQIAAGTATTRSLIVSQVSGGSGGINVAAISRNGDGGGGAGGAGTGTGGGGGGHGYGGNGLGGGGNRIAGGGGVKVAKVTSATATAAADARPLSNSAKPSRTDEEIQIVFDRYKAALYRIYNRELRNDPSLRGKMVLRLTIEPDGSVSACAVKSTDLASPALSADVVERVLKFNFGAKAGVPSITIVYPIDFLPAS
jgi:hypothetical protein